MLLALSSSHAYILARVLIRHILTRLIWKGSSEEQTASAADRKVKMSYLQQLRKPEVDIAITVVGEEATSPFWERDEGVDELTRASKAE